MSEYKSARFRRFIAFLIDVHGCLIIGWFVALATLSSSQVLGTFLFFLCIILSCGYLYCRDWLLGGRSIGKRLCGLSVLDRDSDLPATGKQLLTKNLCYFIAPFDAIVLLLTGRSIGERISDTAVVRSRESSPTFKRRFAVVISVATVLALILSGVVTLALEKAKTNESYSLSLDYLTSSSTFTAQEEPDTELTLVGFSSTTHGTQSSHHYTFETDAHTYSVICHPSGKSWAVCDKCTEFE